MADDARDDLVPYISKQGIIHIPRWLQEEIYELRGKEETARVCYEQERRSHAEVRAVLALAKQHAERTIPRDARPEWYEQAAEIFMDQIARRSLQAQRARAAKPQ